MTKQQLDQIASAGCCVCRKFHHEWSPAEIHHVRRLATSKRRKDAPVIPLCFNHHRGIYGIHTLGRATWEQLYGLETNYIEGEQ